ncbi:N-acetyltransferase [Entomortierella parvispora]|uniref:N-acetyltransferase n=1 Tax=Entomortierella parvispora TaxID=205924 RepID=A0A9P3HD89_9FUNG|nr:N-acetyltransferase [Entomortierella parvispora]
MSTPPSQRSESEPGSSPVPTTPTREYKFHRPVRNTYGRAKPSTPDSSYSSPSLSFVSSNSPSRTNSLLWDQDTPSTSQDRRRSGGRTAGILSDRLAQSKLELNDNSDNDEAMEDESETAEPDTPSKRKKRMLVSAVILPPSPKRSKTAERSLEKAESSNGTKDDNNTNARRRRSGNLSTSSRSPPPPPSPSLSPSKTMVTRRTSANRTALLQDKSTNEKTEGNDTSIVSTNKSAPGSSASDSKSKQATLSAFFSSKAGKGTGILKSRSASTTVASSDPVSTGSFSNKPTLTKDPKSTLSKQPKKLEQMYLAFSKDRTKSSPSSTSNTSKSKIPLSTRSTLLNRESEKSKRFQCPQCGMPYVRGQVEDEQIHERYHRTVLGGIDYPGYKNETVVARYTDDQQESTAKTSTTTNRRISGDFQGSRIVVVSMEPNLATATSGKDGTSTFEKKKVKEVLQVMNEELGSVEFDPEQLEGCKVFMYISGKKKVIGCVVAERIKHGFQLLPTSSSASSQSSDDPSGRKSSPMATSSSILPTPANSASSSSSSTSTALTPPRNKDLTTEGSAIFCSTVPEPAICGINRIWVSKLHRRQKIASRLLEAVRDRFVYACKLEKTDLAFSQPTSDGKALAQRYLGVDRFLVYIE